MKKILVIEDEPEMRRNIRTILELEDFNVVAASNNPPALNISTTTSHNGRR